MAIRSKELQRFALMTLAEYQETIERVKELETLCIRAADTLAYQQKFIHKHCCDGHPSAGELIGELRKAVWVKRREGE
jgi:hypothetical protein